MALTLIQQVRLNIADNTPGLYIISDDEIQYILDNNLSNVTRASIDAARIVLLNLSQRTDEAVDIFSVKGSKAAESYRLALELYLKNPNLNPLIANLQGWVGGVSKSEMLTNNSNLDNNSVISPGNQCPPYSTDWFTVNTSF